MLNAVLLLIVAISQIHIVVLAPRPLQCIRKHCAKVSSKPYTKEVGFKVAYPFQTGC